MEVGVTVEEDAINYAKSTEVRLGMLANVALLSSIITSIITTIIIIIQDHKRNHNHCPVFPQLGLHFDFSFTHPSLTLARNTLQRIQNSETHN